MSEVFNAIKENLTPLSALLIVIVGIIENSEKISAKPLTKLLRLIGSKMNAQIEEKVDEIRLRQLAQEAYSLNDFYQRHINGEMLTGEQYELAVDMFEKHLSVGANSVNRLHLDVLKEYYRTVYGKKND